MINRTSRIALIVISTAIGVFSVPYLRRVISKNTMDYLSAISFLVGGSFFLVLSYGKGRRIESERRGSKLLRISGIMLLLLGMAILIMKLY